MADSNDRGGKRPGRPGGRPPRGTDFSDRPQRGGGGPGGRGKPPGRFGGERPAGRDDRPRPARFEHRDDRSRRVEHERAERHPPRRAETDSAAPEPRVEAAPPAEERIAKVIARAGIASRRDAEAMIAEGRVTLNGEALASPAVNVGPDDRITIDGEPLPSRERTRLWIFHKPRGLVTTARDPEGRPTVFDSLPEEMPRVVAIGRLDINTEGLLLLTNDGGLAKVIAHPETGWTRRYRARAHGEVTQADLDKLKKGVTVDEMEYGAIDATLDRVQGDNVWITLALKEGKNREVKRVLEHLGLQVNRLIRLSFGPFQLGELEQGLVEEVRTRVLKDQLGQALAEQAGVDFESPVREPIAPFGKPEKAASAGGTKRGAPERTPRPRTARFEDDRGERPRGRRFEGREREAGREDRKARPEPRLKPHTVWRADEDEGDELPRRPQPRRADPKADREASATRERKRVGAIASPEGRRVLVERLVSDAGEDERPRRSKGARPTRPPREDGGARPARSGRPNGRSSAGDREERRGPPKGRFGEPRPARQERDGRGPARGGPRPGRPPSGGSRPGGRPGGGPGGKPGRPPRGR